MELVTIFKDFGYPAIVTGVLLWILSTKMEKLSSSVIDMTNVLNELKTIVAEARNDMRENRAEIRELARDMRLLGKQEEKKDD
jgi:hypothetical protein